MSHRKYRTVRAKSHPERLAPDRTSKHEVAAIKPDRAVITRRGEPTIGGESNPTHLTDVVDVSEDFGPLQVTVKNPRPPQ